MRLTAPFLIILDAVLALAAIYSAAVVRFGFAEVSTKQFDSIAMSTAGIFIVVVLVLVAFDGSL